MTKTLSLENVLSEVIPKLADPETVAKNSGQSPNGLSSWDPLTLSHGLPGLLLLFSTLEKCFPEGGFDSVSHTYVLAIKEAIEKEGVGRLDLFSGVTGICFALDHASHEKTRYKRLIDRLNVYLKEQLTAQVFPDIDEKIAKKLPWKMDDFDVISGLTGIGAYFSTQNDYNPLTQEITKRLIALTRPITVAGHEVPGWFTPVHYQFIESDKQQYPKGNFNLGMAHGIAGVLAYFSHLLIKGIELPGLKEGTCTLAEWLLSQKIERGDTCSWPNRVSWEDIVEKEDVGEKRSADAWCYGSAGVCRSLFLAGKSLKNKELQNAALEGFHQCLKRFNQGQRLTTLSFCHGLAGFLTQSVLMGCDVEPQVRLILDHYDESTPFGFMDNEPDLKNGGNLVPVAKPGLLEGAAGVVLALLSSQFKEHSWTYPFLIQGEI